MKLILTNQQYSGHNVAFPTLKRQEGFTLIELVVMIILLGVAIPSIFALYSQLSVTATKSKVMDQMMAYGETKMEEIIATKEKNWNWYQTANQFAENVALPNDYNRTVSVQAINNWGNVGVDAWEISVTVTHPLINNNYELIVRLTQYEY